MELKKAKGDLGIDIDDQRPGPTKKAAAALPHFHFKRPRTRGPQFCLLFPFFFALRHEPR